MAFEFDIIDESLELEQIEFWQSTCFIANNPYHALLKNELKQLVYADQERSSTAIKSDVAVNAKKHLFESELDFLAHPDANIQMLSTFLTDLINTVATTVNTPFWPEGAQANSYIIESWYHLTKNGGFHDAHSHPNCSWCAIYYLDIGDSSFSERNGVNRFYDPRHNADQYLDAGSQYLNSSGIWDIEPVEGQVVIFPSYLKHSALPYFGDNDRIVIAINAHVDLS